MFGDWSGAQNIMAAAQDGLAAPVPTEEDEAEYRSSAYGLQRGALRHAAVIHSVAACTLFIIAVANGTTQSSVLSLRAVSAAVSGLLFVVLRLADHRLRSRRALILAPAWLVLVGSLAIAVDRLQTDAAQPEAADLVAVYLVAYALLVPCLPLRVVGAVMCGFWLLQALLLLLPDRPAQFCELSRGLALNAAGLVIGHASERHHRANFALARRFKHETAQNRAAVDHVHSLLCNTLPAPVVKQIASGSRTFAHRYENVTVLQADMVGFTTLSGERGPQEVLQILGALFHEFDLLTETHRVHKVRRGDTVFIPCAPGLWRVRRSYTECAGAAVWGSVLRLLPQPPPTLQSYDPFGCFAPYGVV